MQYLFLLTTLLGTSLYAAEEDPLQNMRVLPAPESIPTYTILRASGPIQIDGRLTEDDWLQASVIDFVQPWSDAQKEGSQGTRVRLLWDDSNLYIIYQCQDPFLDAQVDEHDGPVYKEDAVEIFATPNPDNISAYYGYEMNINGTLLDYIAFGGGSEWTENIHAHWQSEGVEIATTYVGTLNEHSDQDESWILEIAIPLDNFRHLGGQIPPHDGDRWRAGLNRTAGHRGQFGLWSDTHQPKPAFHHSIYFGELVFSGQSVGKR